jgi:hypothetical protein
MRNTEAILKRTLRKKIRQFRVAVKISEKGIEKEVTQKGHGGKWQKGNVWPYFR